MDSLTFSLNFQNLSNLKLMKILISYSKNTKLYKKNNHKLHSAYRNIVDKIVIKKSLYSKIGKKLPLDKVSLKTQRRRLHSFTSTTTEIAS